MLNDDDRFKISWGAGTTDWPVEFDAALRDGRPSLLIVAATADQPELRAMAQGADFRILDAVPPAEMAGRLRRTVGVDAMLVDLRGLVPADARLDAALAKLLAWPAWSDARPLLLVDEAALDAVTGALDIDFNQLLCDPSLSEIGLALCLLARDSAAGSRLNDIDRDSDAARLEQLSAEVRRLAQTIDRLAREEPRETGRILHDRDQDYAPAPPASSDPSGWNDGGISAERDRKNGTDSSASRAEVRALLQARRLRDRFLPGDLFADPAWDMMLDLMAARLDGKRVSVSSLCIAAAVPPTTALRWITQLTERGIFHRHNDPDDARRVFIALSDEAADSLAGWFSAARRTGLRFAG
ncbi:hypothetical protein BH10PSE13_BH10PSE13_01420 [soil metagenome]